METSNQRVYQELDRWVCAGDFADTVAIAITHDAFPRVGRIKTLRAVCRDAVLAIDVSRGEVTVHYDTMIRPGPSVKE